MDKPLVTVVTATHNRHKQLNECCQSVRGQSYNNIEHVIVSDGRDVDILHFEIASLRTRVFALGRNRHANLPSHSIGSIPRSVGAWLARGDLIAYLDDDDLYYPHHVEALVEQIQAGAEIAYAAMDCVVNGVVTQQIGGYPPARGLLGTSCIMHRQELLLTSTWSHHDSGDDWKLVERWLAAGFRAAYVDRPGVRYSWWRSPDSKTRP